MKKTTNPKLARLEKELATEHEAKLRLAAELANVQKRAEQEKLTIGQRARAAVLRELFPVLDNLYRASFHAPTISLDDDYTTISEEAFKQIHNYFQGLRQIEKQLEDVLAQAGLKRIETAGEQFNPKLHEAVSSEPSLDIPADHIIAEVEAGWTIDDTVIKPAKVRVSKG